MARLDVWEMILLAVAAFIAVRSLVMLMQTQRTLVGTQLYRQAQEELARQKLAEAKARQTQARSERVA